MKVQVERSFINHFESVGQSKWLIPQDAVFVSCLSTFSNINEKGIYNNAYTLYIARPPRNAANNIFQTSG